MFVRALFSLGAFAAVADLTFGQQLNSAFETRPTVPAAYAATTVPKPVKSEPTLLMARLLRPVAEQPATPKTAPAKAVVVNPAAPPGFNGPCPVYDCDDRGEGTGAPGRFWATGQWLYWATSGQPLPVLASASPVGTARTLAGTLGSPNSATLFGGDRANKDFRNGYRLTAGWWFDDCRTCGIEGDFFFLGNSRAGFATASNGSQIISRPFFNALTGREDAQLVSFPGALGGSLTADVRNSLIGGGVNAVHNLCGSPCGRLDALIGYRYWNVSDEVHIRENLTALAGQNLVPAGTRFQIQPSTTKPTAQTSNSTQLAGFERPTSGGPSP